MVIIIKQYVLTEWEWELVCKWGGVWEWVCVSEWKWVGVSVSETLSACVCPLGSDGAAKLSKNFLLTNWFSCMNIRF